MPGCRAGLGGGRLTGHHPSAVTLTYGTPYSVMAKAASFAGDVVSKHQDR
jgi:hypothetical protein